LDMSQILSEISRTDYPPFLPDLARIEAVMPGLSPEKLFNPMKLQAPG
jgi:hypothetical protein